MLPLTSEVRRQPRGPVGGQQSDGVGRQLVPRHRQRLDPQHFVGQEGLDGQTEVKRAVVGDVTARQQQQPDLYRAQRRGCGAWRRGSSSAARRCCACVARNALRLQAQSPESHVERDAGQKSKQRFFRPTDGSRGLLVAAEGCGVERREVHHPGRSLMGKKKVFQNQFSQKGPRALHVLNHGWWRLAVGGWRLAVGGWRLAVGNWRLVVVGGGWWLVIGGWWRLAVVGSWRLVAAGGWQRLVAGGWWLAVGGGWRLMGVGGWRLMGVGGWRLVVPWGGP